LLPTPQARDHYGAQSPQARRAGGRQVNLNDIACSLAAPPGRLITWGEYETAIRRWEAILGRPAPSPAQPGRTGQLRMNPELPEFLLGLPPGWVTAVPGLPYAAMIKALGNGVVPQQATAALRLLLQVANGFPADPGPTGEHGQEIAA